MNNTECPDRYRFLSSFNHESRSEFAGFDLIKGFKILAGLQGIKFFVWTGVGSWIPDEMKPNKRSSHPGIRLFIQGPATRLNQRVLKAQVFKSIRDISVRCYRML